jgi:CheY-like chemotaxis protein
MVGAFVARILVVDDEAQTREMLLQMLEREGHEVQVAEDGAVALDLCRQAQFDLVLTDILMPNKEGLETITELRREYPQLKIIVMSGGSRTSHMNFLGVAKMLGAHLALAKPIARQEILEAISAVLEQA